MGCEWHFDKEWKEGIFNQARGAALIKEDHINTERIKYNSWFIILHLFTCELTGAVASSKRHSGRSK